jgi:hypothetical protein
MLCSFLKFIEEIEESNLTPPRPESNLGSSVSSPQHEVGEESLSLNKVVEKRIKEMLNNFKTKGRATEQEVLSSIDYNLKNKFNFQKPQQSQKQTQDSSNQENKPQESNPETPQIPNLG